MLTEDADPRRVLGDRGEELAVEHLAALGLEILERNFRSRHGELDVVAADERYLVFCEVKTRVVRTDPGALGPLSAIGPEKRRRVRALASEWLARPRSGRPHPPEIRFDAIGVSYDGAGRLVSLEHLEAAF